MPNQFDPYREALVVEQKTVWPPDVAEQVTDPARRARIEERLHAEPALAAELQYVRLATGFVREITVTADDLKRLNTPS
jgi:hypothetical protein